MKYSIKFKALLLAVALFGVMTPQACKDAPPDTLSANREACLEYLNQSDWDNAVTTCEKLVERLDSGGNLAADISQTATLTGEPQDIHLLAQAYMGRGGITLTGIALELATAPSPIALIIGMVPATIAETADYMEAADLLMRWVVDADRTSTMNLEGLLVSSMLIYKELVGLFNLSADANGNLLSCVDPFTGDMSACSFAFNIATPPNFDFSGLGTSFYEGVCLSAQATTPNSQVSSNTLSFTDGNGINFTGTVNGCKIMDYSPLHHNKIAGEQLALNLTDPGLLAAVGVLGIAANMEVAGNYTISLGGNAATMCTGAAPAYASGAFNDPGAGLAHTPVVSDGILNDCEVLKYFVP